MSNFYNFVYKGKLNSINRDQLTEVFSQLDPKDDCSIEIWYSSSHSDGVNSCIYKFKDRLSATKFHKELVEFKNEHPLSTYE